MDNNGSSPKPTEKSLLDDEELSEYLRDNTPFDFNFGNMDSTITSNNQDIDAPGE
jgi:uncharacterized protein YozE (UPF0346 family)